MLRKIEMLQNKNYYILIDSNYNKKIVLSSK